MGMRKVWEHASKLHREQTFISVLFKWNCMCVWTSSAQIRCCFVDLFWMSWEEEEEQTLVANDCSRLMKTGFSCESSLSCRVSILGIMRVLCGDYQQMKVMSICLWWIDRVHLELWQIGMELNGDNLESHIHHWIVWCCWRTSWFQWIFIDTKNRDDDMNHLLFLNWLFQWDGHKTGIVIAIDGDVCQTVSVNDKYVLPDSISHFDCWKEWPWWACD